MHSSNQQETPGFCSFLAVEFDKHSVRSLKVPEKLGGEESVGEDTSSSQKSSWFLAG